MSTIHPYLEEKERTGHRLSTEKCHSYSPESYHYIAKVCFTNVIGPHYKHPATLYTLKTCAQRDVDFYAVLNILTGFKYRIYIN